MMVKSQTLLFTFLFLVLASNSYLIQSASYQQPLTNPIPYLYQQPKNVQHTFQFIYVGPAQTITQSQQTTTFPQVATNQNYPSQSQTQFQYSSSNTANTRKTNAVSGINNNIDGYDNTVNGDYNGIKGFYNQVNGNQNGVVGNLNGVVGNSNQIQGHSNGISGTGNMIFNKVF